MKPGQFLIYLLFAISPLMSHAQRAAFGPFVIDSSTIGNLETLTAASGLVIRPYHDSVELDYSGRTSHLYSISEGQDLDRLPGPHVSFTVTADNRLLYFDNLLMGELLVTSMWLGYRKGVLQFLQCDAKVQLTLSLHQYYGKGITTERSITLSCKRGLEDTIVRTIPQFVTEWPLAYGAIGSYTIGSYFDESCMLQRYAVFRLESRNAE